MALFPPPPPRPSAHSGRLVLVAVLMGLLAAALLVAGNIARAQDPPEPTTHQITRGDTDTELQTSLNAVWDSNGGTLAAVKQGDTIEFGPGVYEDIGRRIGFYLRLDQPDLTARGARDPRKGEADGECDPAQDTILTGSSAFELNDENITLEHFCFQNIDDGSLALANPANLPPIRALDTADDATLRRNRIDNTIGRGVDGRISGDELSGILITENEFIDIGLIETNGAGDSIQPRHTGQEPSAIQIDTSHEKSNLTITDNLFEGSAWAAVSLYNVDGGTISGNTFRNMAKSAVFLRGSDDVTLDNNTYESNNRAAWRVVRTANWLNDGTYGISGIGTLTTGSKRATMESAALQTLLRLTKDEAVAAGMDGDLYAAATANTVYRDPDLHAAVRVVGSTNVAISNSTFTRNHNSIAICGDVVCRVEGLEAVGDAGDAGRSPAYISPTTFPGGATRTASTVTLSGNEFNNSDTRSVDAPGSVGNHLVIGYHRAASTYNDVASELVGSFTYGAGNSFSGSGVFGGKAAEHVSDISIESASADVVEGAGIVFNLTIDPPARANDLTVHYSVSEVGSWVGRLRDDFPALAGDQFRVAEGVASAVLTVPTVSDHDVDETDGSITVTIEPGDLYNDGATATVVVRDGPAPRPVVVAPPPIFIPPPPRFKKDEVAVVDGAAKLEANKVTVDLGQGSLPENVEVVEATVTKLTRSKTPDAPDSGRFRIAYAAVYEVELEATLADETTEPLTELAAPATVCLPIPRTVNNAVVLRHDAETEEWVKLPPADSAEEDEVCALSASISVYAVANEADHSEGLSATQINDFAVWEADYPLNASDLLAVLLDVNVIWVWYDETWIGYATFEGEPIPGAVDFLIANGDTLWLGSIGSGGDG